LRKFKRYIGIILNYFSFLFRGIKIKGTNKIEIFSDLQNLINDHFVEELNDHINIKTMEMALKEFNQLPLNIIETGSAGYGTKSSLLFDKYVSSFGGTLETVDIDITKLLSLRNKCTHKTTFCCDDSVTFLKKIKIKNPDFNTLVYLDSWDVDLDNPLDSSIHGLKEFQSIYKKLKKGDVILIDDTPKDTSVLKKIGVQPLNNHSNNDKIGGKGSLIKLYVLEYNLCEILYQDYQLVLRVI